MNTPPFLQTPRLDLRPLIAADADGPYLRWFNDPEVCRYNSHHIVPYRREDALSYVNYVSNSKTDLVLAIVQQSDERHIGNVSLQNINFIDRSAEFAIVLGERDCWGKGYSKEAAQALLHHGFTALNLHRIYCGTSVDNLPMQKLALHLKMKQEGVRRDSMFKHGRYVDVIDYGVLQMEYLVV